MGAGRLDRWEVLAWTQPGEAGIQGSKAIGVFAATPDEVFRIATDYEHLADFAPRVVSSRIVDRRGEAQATVELHADLPWPLSSAWVSAQFEHEDRGGGVYRIKFFKVAGSLRRYAGAMLIEPWSSGRTAVTYELLVEPESRAPKSMLNGRLHDAASRYVHALRQRVDELHRLGRLHPEMAPNPNLPSELSGPREVRVVGRVAKARP
jgi:ribosome-associated toxin RatA of RatAB toxin-antitoxin module